jgi:hypothetical protein
MWGHSATEEKKKELKFEKGLQNLRGGNEI